MNVSINYLSVLIAAIASMLVGFLWYGPLFGKQWVRLSGLIRSDLNTAKTKGMTKAYVLTLIGSLIMAYALDHSLIFASAYLQSSGVSAGVMAGFWTWFGFVAPVTLGIVLWEGKSWKLWLINNSYHLVSLLAMGVILSLWK